jgi:hypothetical protein
MKKHFPIYMGTAIGLFLSLIAFVLFIYYSNYSDGEIFKPYDIKDVLTPRMEALQDDFRMLLDHYTDQVQIVSSAFAFLAFLVTYQSKSNIQISSKAWGFLVTGVIVLILSLVLSQFGKELLYTMSIRNSVDIDLRALKISRLTNYFCFVIAAFCIGFYALEIAKTIISPPSKLESYEVD